MIYHRECKHCGEEFHTEYETKLYCRKQCSKQANRKRKTRKIWKSQTIICCICGIEAPRKRKVSVTCGSKECVNEHRQDVKNAINAKYREQGIVFPSQLKKHTIKKAHKALNGIIEKFKEMCIPDTIDLPQYCKQCNNEFYSKRVKYCCSETCTNKHRYWVKGGKELIDQRTYDTVYIDVPCVVCGEHLKLKLRQYVDSVFCCGRPAPVMVINYYCYLFLFLHFCSLVF